MTDAHKDRSELVTALADNTSGDILEQTVRNWLLSSLLRNRTTYTALTPTIDDDDVVVYLDGTSNTVTALLATPTTSYPLKIVKAINVDNAVALDPGVNNLEGATDDYVFATVNDCIMVHWDGSAWRTLFEFLNA